MEQETEATEELSEQDIIEVRKRKLAHLRELGNAFPNDFKRDSLANNIHTEFDDKTAEELESLGKTVRVAGRVMLRRVMGKASFLHIQDMSGRIQLYLRRDDLPEGVYQEFKKWDIGDIVGAEGKIFKTKTGELSIKATKLFLLTKSLRPLPDKFHGLADTELRYRQRYLDLISNDDSRKTFMIRSKIISFIRDFMIKKGFLEVETPMMQPIPGGAAARPFVTHHNTLDMKLFLRIAPELYLKRLVVGGFEKVFEINRSFRNEGVSTQHNPEFTMLEFYQAYADYQDLMNLTEEMLRELTQTVLDNTTVTFNGKDYDFSKPFARHSLKGSILYYNQDVTEDELNDLDKAREVAKRKEVPIEDSFGLGKIQLEIFEKTVEHHLLEPTFITAYPTEVSPLARQNTEDPFLTDRFELFIAGFELANGFSELNDPEDQAERFQQQVKDKQAGDDEAMHYDADYITALEYGMPPTAGEGIGIDRLVMLLTDSHSIRDVLLFPQMRLVAEE